MKQPPKPTLDLLIKELTEIRDQYGAGSALVMVTKDSNDTSHPLDVAHNWDPERGEYVSAYSTGRWLAAYFPGGGPHSDDCGPDQCNLGECSVLPCVDLDIND